ncbi:MAG: hypothetical protein PHC64_09455 [Candidatus Gastranaerophilales bacterium]|nr:hypothetical protein [Candidatus Gastranaerophilales bacterium]
MQFAEICTLVETYCQHNGYPAYDCSEFSKGELQPLDKFVRWCVINAPTNMAINLGIPEKDFQEWLTEYYRRKRGDECKIDVRWL